MAPLERRAAPGDAAASTGGRSAVPEASNAPPPARLQPPRPAAAGEEDDIYPMPFAVCIRHDHGTALPGRALPALVEARLPLPLVQRLAAAGASVWATLAWGTGSGPTLLRTPAAQLASASELAAAAAVFAAAAAAAAAAGGAGHQHGAPPPPAAGLLPGGQRLSLPVELPPLLQLLRADPPLLSLQVFRRSAVDDPSSHQLESPQRGAGSSDSSHAASTSQAAAEPQRPGPHPSGGDGPPTDELLATLPLLLLQSAAACAEVMGLMPLPSAEAAGGLLAGRAFAAHVAPMLLTLADALSGPQQQQALAAPAAAAGGISGRRQPHHQLAAYASEVERLLVLLLSRDMTHTARHLVAAAERAGVAFANRHLLIEEEEEEEQPETPEEMESPLLPLATLPRLAVGSAAAAAAAEGGDEQQDALSGFETPPAARPREEPPRLGRLQQQWSGGDSPAGNSGSWGSTTPRAPVLAAEPVPASIAALLEAFASQAASAVVAARVGSPTAPQPPASGGPLAQPPEPPAPRVGGAAAVAAGASTSAAPGAESGAREALAAKADAPATASPSLGALLSVSLSGGFPCPADEADYHIYKAAALRPAAGLLLLIEALLMPLAMLLVHGPSSLPSPFNLSLLAFAAAVATGPILGALAGAAPAAPPQLHRVAEWLAAWRSGVVALCQAAEAGVVLWTAWGPGEGLRKLMTALGSYPVPFILYGQLLKPALLQLNPKPAAACTLLRVLEHSAALAMAAAGSPSDGRPSASKAALPAAAARTSRWPIALLMAATSAGGLVATAAGDVLLRVLWARGGAARSGGGSGVGGAPHAKAE